MRGPSRRTVLAAMTVLTAAPSFAQPRPASPALSASRSVMAGSMLGVTVARAPSGARLAIARPEDPADRAIIVLPLTAGATASLLTPGEPGLYELRLTQGRDGAPIILLRQPLATTPASATVTGPARVARGNGLPVRGIGPNGAQDRVTIVPKDAPTEATGPSFFPFENVEATLEAPDEPGAYELRYVMHAPLAEHRVLARQPVTVE
jgi:Ca-activated chloride channel family protein